MTTFSDLPPVVARYGEWISPISAADVAEGGHPVEGGAFVGGDIWWAEQRPTEGGRIAIRRHDGSGQAVDVLPAPWNARTRVHEYGGGAWTVTDAGVLVFAEFTDQRLYRLDPGASAPVPLTPAPVTAAGVRYGNLSIVGAEIMAVRETHGGEPGTVTVTRDIVRVPLDGSAAQDAAAVPSLVAGSHFLAAPAVSPDGRHLAWIAWEHPQMPWDGTELRVGELGEDGTVTSWRVLAGSTEESVLQPLWRDASTLYFSSDRTGWWNLYRQSIDAGSSAEALHPAGADFGGPLWQLGAGWFSVLPDGRLLTSRTHGTDTLGILDPADGSLTDLRPTGLEGDLTVARLGRTSGDRVLLLSAGTHDAAGLRVLDLTDLSLSVVRLGVDHLPAAGLLPVVESMTFPAPHGRQVHAFVYPPRNPGFVAHEGELPPYVTLVHGGPTAHVSAQLSVATAYFTSRGIGVIDVNYGGSTGYGREYRNRLRGNWGVVDVEDTIAAVTGLAAAGWADPTRIAIQGGSAGGWTVLAALTGAGGTSTSVFACGASYFGVAELVEFVKETHDFESRYIDGLVGPWPEAADLYTARAPLSHVDALECPVLLLQGLDDPVVPPAQAERFRDAMVAKGIPHAYLAYEGESHGFRRRETLISSKEAELSFYGQIMGFAPVDVPVLPLWRPS
ncbi:S9 family peptidase [Nakamurella silvestris]|nr:S9 family peptidase [Nakamurella silvestris]